MPTRILRKAVGSSLNSIKHARIESVFSQYATLWWIVRIGCYRKRYSIGATGTFRAGKSNLFDKKNIISNNFSVNLSIHQYKFRHELPLFTTIYHKIPLKYSPKQHRFVRIQAILQLIFIYTIILHSFNTWITVYFYTFSICFHMFPYVSVYFRLFLCIFIIICYICSNSANII